MSADSSSITGALLALTCAAAASRALLLSVSLFGWQPHESWLTTLIAAIAAAFVLAGRETSSHGHSPEAPIEVAGVERSAEVAREAAAAAADDDEQREVWWQSESREFTQEQENAIAQMLESHFGANAPASDKLRKVVVRGDARAAAVRALTARRFDVAQTRKLVDDMIAWREANKVDDILSTEPLDEETLHSIRSCLFDGFTGICKEGNPIYIMLGGKMDLAKCKRLVGIETILKYHIMVMEYCNQVYYSELSEKVGRTTTKVTLLLDLSGFGGHNVKSDFWEVMNALSNIDNNYYYEFLGKVLIINGGVFFRLFWKTASPLLQPDTKRKFKVLSNLKEIEQHIPLHQLAQKFGGTMSNSGAFCTEEEPWTNMYKRFDAFVLDQCRPGRHSEDFEDEQKGKRSAS